MLDRDAEIGAEPLGLFDAIDIGQRGWLRGPVSVDLRTVEDGVGAGEDAVESIVVIGVLVRVTQLLAHADFPEDDSRALLPAP
jgi:hypothetical protein